jgi:hypothetical protein
MCARLSQELATTEDPTLWKWVLISLHSAVQGIMVLSLRGGNGLAALKPKSEQEWLRAYRSGKKPPEERLDDFPGLYRKVKGQRMLQYVHSKAFTPSSTHDVSMSRLNRLRNHFIHFLPGSWTLQLSGVPPVLMDSLTLADFLVRKSGNILWRKPECQGRYAKAFDSCEAAFTQLRVKLTAQPDGAANGSQPIRPETNRTPSAAGSRR